jgi:hypothetical protein
MGRAAGSTGDFPIEAPGDLVHETGLGQSNFFHAFGTELNDYMTAITAAGQFWWVERDPLSGRGVCFRAG